MSTSSTIPTSITRTILQRLPLPQFPGWESRMVRLEYGPGVAAPLHNHPVAATGFIVEGGVVSQWEGGEIERYSAGDSFIDRGETLHVLSENSSSTDRLTMVVNYVIRVDEANVNPVSRAAGQ